MQNQKLNNLWIALTASALGGALFLYKQAYAAKLQKIKEKQPLKFLIGDVGGTNVRLQIFELNSEKEYEYKNAIKSQTYNSSQFATFLEFVQDFLMNDFDNANHPDFAIIGIAGSIYENKSKLANTDWTEVDGNEIGLQLSIKPFVLLNDFHTLSYGVLGLKSKYLQEIVSVAGDHRDQVKVVTGPGTGLGVALLLPTHGHYRVHPTEGGHRNFSAQNRQELQFHEYMMHALNNECVQLEQATAGSSIPYMYNFIKSTNPNDKLLLEAELQGSQFGLENPKNFPSNQVFNAGIIGDDQVCRKTLDLFCELYESLLGDMITYAMPFGGIYLVGGLTNSLKVYLQERQKKGLFMKTYKEKRPYFDHVFKRVPIYIILKEDLGLEGAYQTALRLNERGMIDHHL